MSFSFFKTAPSLSFVFNIRDTSISIAAVRFDKEKKPEIVLCQDFDLKQKDSRYYKEYLPSMLGVLDEAIIDFRKNLVKIDNQEKIDSYYFFIGSPWSLSQTKTINIVKDKVFEINNQMLSQILSGEEYSIEKSLEENTSNPNWEILEERIVQSKINGYKVDTFFGKRATNFAVELFVTYVPGELKDKLSQYLDSKIGRKIKRQLNSTILTSYSFFRDLYSNKNDFIYLDIGKLITDLYVVRDDVIFGIASIPFGEEDIIQASLTRTNLTRDIFMSHINIGLDKNFELNSHNNVEDLLSGGFEILEEKIKDTLPKICTEMNIPSDMFIIKNSTISNLLTKELSNKSKNGQFQLLGTNILISPISENVLNSFILNGREFINQPYIKMNLVFLDKLLKSKQ